MEQKDKLMKIFKVIAILHVIEAPIGYRAAKKRGENPKKYFLLTAIFGVFVLVPLLRKPKLGKKVDI